MIKISDSIFLLIVSNLVNGWVFTDIQYDRIVKPLFDDYKDFKEYTSEELKQMKFSLIYPGTKWCGPGNIADSYDDLGSAVEADECCREHDNCPDIIPAGETRYNLTNKAFYTRLSCDCDERFRRCLRAANNNVATQIGSIYFNALDTQCFRKDYPITGCKRHSGWLNQKCVKYTYNKNGEKIYQWFDEQNF